MNLLVNSGIDTASASFTLEAGAAGTSFAAPQVAGVAALMMAVDPSLTVDEVRSLLQSTATAYTSFTVPSAAPSCDATHTDNCKCTDATCGAGVLNASAAITAAGNVYLPNIAPTTP